MSANRGAWVGDRAFRCHETERSVFLFANSELVVANTWSAKAREAALVARKMKVGGMGHEDHDATAQAVERRAKQYQANSLKDAWGDVADAHRASSKALRTSSIQDHYSASVYHHRAAESMKLIGDDEKAKSHRAMSADHDKILERLDPEAKTKVKHPDMEERLTSNSVSLSAGSIDDFAVFTNEQAPIQAANAETRLRRVMLAPYGDWPNSRGLQRFQKVDAEEIVKEFSNVVNKLLNPASWLGLPWYEGHPDHPDFRGKPGHTRATAVGRIKSLEAGDDGLYANVKFNEDGERLISNESYHGHSVNWFLTRDKQAANAFRPFRLKSVGFTNEPNIPVPAVTLANAGTSEGARIGWQHRTGAAYKASSIATSFDAQLHRGEFGDITPARLRQSAEMHEEAARAHNSANYNVENAYDISESQARIVGSAHSDHSSYHKRIARRHLDEADRMSVATKTGANSSPISRFRAMAQMREMANGAPIGNKNAFGKHHNWFVSGHKESIDFHKPKAEYYEGLAHLGDEYKELAKFHRKRADFHQEELSKLLSANSQSRFSVLRGMREALNVPKHQANLQHSQQK